MNKIILHFVTFLVLLDISNTTSFETAYVLFVISVVFIAFQVLNRIRMRRAVIVLFVLWILLNILSSAQFRSTIGLPNIVRTGVHVILLPASLLTIFGSKFLENLERYIYWLTFISLPLFLLNLIFTSTFNSFTPIFIDISNQNLSSNINYWSMIIYVNARQFSFGGTDLWRNSGFMWEPGYFALMIIVGLGYRWLRLGIKFDMTFWVYLVAMITTFSTAGYLAFIFLASAFFLKKTSFSRLILFMLFMIGTSYYLYSFDFVGGKINTYVDAMQADQFSYSSFYDAVKLNRFQIAFYDLSRVYRYPFGFGLNDRISFEGVDVFGTNGLSGLLRMWGVFIFVYFVHLLYKYHQIVNVSMLNRNQVLLIFLSLLFVFFSQSIQYNIIAYLLIVTPIIFREQVQNSIKYKIEAKR